MSIHTHKHAHTHTHTHTHICVCVCARFNLTSLELYCIKAVYKEDEMIRIIADDVLLI